MQDYCADADEMDEVWAQNARISGEVKAPYYCVIGHHVSHTRVCMACSSKPICIPR